MTEDQIERIATALERIADHYTAPPPQPRQPKRCACIDGPQPLRYFPRICAACTGVIFTDWREGPTTYPNDPPDRSWVETTFPPSWRRWRKERA